MESGKQITCICIVSRRKRKDDLIAALKGAGVNLINTVYGKGLVKASVLQDMLGLLPEENKVVLFCMTTQAKCDVVLKLLVEKFDFERPNTGIAFTIPIEAVSY